MSDDWKNFYHLKNVLVLFNLYMNCFYYKKHHLNKIVSTRVIRSNIFNYIASFLNSFCRCRKLYYYFNNRTDASLHYLCPLKAACFFSLKASKLFWLLSIEQKYINLCVNRNTENISLREMMKS
jgi:hypothetical protein